MRKRLCPISSLFLLLNLAVLLRAQSPSTTPPPSPPAVQPSSPHLDYPDSTSGLEHLVKDILKAQKTNDASRADALLESLVLPQPRVWYDQVFGGDVPEEVESFYEKASASIPPSVARFLLDAQAHQLDEVKAVRFDKSCDDNAGEDAFGILHARIESVPLYELRLFNGNKFVRLFALVYVDGAFRYVLTPKMDGKVFHSPASNNPAAKPNNAQALESRVRVGGAVQAAKLLHRVQPHYPDLARREHLEGTVRLHALIAKDGSLSRLYVIKGYCSLAEASLNAVSQWRYAPTLFNGEPVEVDTEIDVTFALSH